MTEDTVYLTPRQVADRYHGAVSTETLSNWRVVGKGPSYTKIGGRVLYPLHLLVEWEKTRTVNNKEQS